jgi:simple sugar transport system substrate-binding protein
MKNSRLGFLWFLIFGGVLLSGCGKQTTPIHEDKVMYHFTVVVYGTAGNPFWVKVVNGAKDAAKMTGCTVDIQYADDDPVKQNDIIETALASKVNGLGISINQKDAYDKVIEKAINAGVPVIAFNNDDPEKAKGNKRMAYIGQDEAAAGYAVTRRLIAEAGLKKGDHVVCPVEHPPATYAMQRYKGVKQALDESEVSSEVLDTGAASLDDTLTRMTQYLLGHKNTAAILAMGGMPMEMAPQASVDAGKLLPNAGYDITKVIAENLRAGKTVAVVDQKPYYQGYFTVIQLYNYCKYGLYPCDIDTGGGIIDKGNVADVIRLSDSVR